MFQSSLKRPAGFYLVFCHHHKNLWWGWPTGPRKKQRWPSWDRPRSTNVQLTHTSDRASSQTQPSSANPRELRGLG